ncbi:MAG: BREX-2 system adenine-specific DNA-methyltransferase PglX [Pseudomonadales bacterium]|nr:BREX-2 system adenine-specific DNA-methyltransferase PglX [Pseudomonadales bacterium]
MTQAAVAWVLTCVFVRFMEDNGLLEEPVLSGPVLNAKGDKSLQHAKECLIAYFNENPTHAEREYLLSLFAQLEQYPVIAELLDYKHNPLWQIPISADGAKQLIDFFQKIDVQTGEIVHDFTDPEWDTRFLGDLYQDLSEAVRKRYALLQTPEFVESFILDYTLEKAKDTFGLPGLRLIDPTCGSGHFLLTTFERVFDDWLRREPATNTRELAQRALSVVHGVDINPYAIAICRFRLLIVAMKAAGSDKIKDAPDFHFNLACGDSLLHGRRFESTSGLQASLMGEDDPFKHVMASEDEEMLKKLLGQQYHVVVGNPPYITVADPAANAAYRAKYQTCHRQYSLGVPFTERFFDLTLSGNGNRPAGYVGMITANSFMKREFGKPLIEKYLTKRDLTHVIDTSGAYIPGHGTPTIILFARNQSPKSDQLKAVLGIKGEPGSPSNAEDGFVWNSIVDLVDQEFSENEYISVVSKSRTQFSTHPWSLNGGGAPDLAALIEGAKSFELNDFAKEIGFGVVTREDDAFHVSTGAALRQGVLQDNILPLVVGENVRGWSISGVIGVIWPYVHGTLKADVYDEPLKNALWPLKKPLSGRVAYGNSQIERGLEWFEYSMFFTKRYRIEKTITFPFVSTHNHFSLDRGNKVFNRTAPVIKLPSSAGEIDHLVLLGLLNSSVACFWGRQVFFPKGGFSDGKWEERLEWDSTKLKRFPIPSPIEPDIQNETRLLPGYTVIEQLAGEIDELAQDLSHQLPLEIINRLDEKAVSGTLDKAKLEGSKLRSKMVALQEELDWHCYQAYGLLDEAMVYEGELPLVQAGERAFEIQLAREIAQEGGSNAWFTRHDLVQTTEIPESWPEDYKALIEKRLAVMQSERFIKLIEKPEYKRRWLPLEWDKQEQAALQNWLLTFLEKRSFDVNYPSALTCAQLSDSIDKDEMAKAIAQRYTNNEFFEAQPLVEKLIAAEHIPQMAGARLKPAAMKKYRAWQETWDKQRQEDAIDEEYDVFYPLAEEYANDTEKLAAYEKAKLLAKAKKAELIGDIPLPPKYAKSDFQSVAYWPLRGKLDVAKERFFSLPSCEKDGDTTLVIGWAGMNHLQRAQAIAAWYLDRKEIDGWEAEKLKPMLVALDELIPWLKQWHNEVDPEFGERMGDYYEAFLMDELRVLNVSRDELLSWEPPIAVKKKKAAKKTKAKKITDEAETVAKEQG